MKEVVLHKDLGYLQIDNTGPQVGIGPNSFGVAGSWKKTNFNLFVLEEQIDIGGLTDMKFTFFPTGGDVQRGGPVAIGQTGGFITESIFVTSSPVKITTNFQAQAFRLPLQANSDFKNIIWGRKYTYALDTSLPQNFGRQIHTSLVGSGEPTNSDTLYVYRIVTLQARTPASGFAELPTCRLILTGQMKEEAEYQQLMRFRRSYELAQGYDSD